MTESYDAHGYQSKQEYERFLHLRCFVLVNNMSIRYQQMKSKGNQTLELENSPQIWKYYE